jgi:hypothetical protein
LNEYKLIGAIPYIPAQFIYLSKAKVLTNAPIAARKYRKNVLPTSSAGGYLKVYAGV